MKIMVVSPVPTYATWDVFEGHVQGLRAIEGVGVIRVNYSTLWNMYSDFKEFVEVTGRADYDSVNHTLMAGDRLVGQAIVSEADLVHFVAPMHIHPATLRILKQYVGCKTSAYFTECPYDDEWAFKLATLFDYCFVCDRASVDLFRKVNMNSHYIGHAYNPEKHIRNGTAEKESDVLFIGTNFPSRIEFLGQVDWNGINFHLNGLMKKVRSPLKQFVRGTIAMPNKESLEHYKKTRIGLQLHRKDSYDPIKASKGKKAIEGGLLGAFPIENLSAHSLGPRSYELAACGVFQVTDAGRPELEEVFGDTVPVYTTPEELGTLLRRYLDDPVQREEMAAKQHEAVQPYTFENRMRTVVDVIS